MIIESSGFFISLGIYGIYLFNEVVTVGSKIEEIYKKEVERKKQNPDEPVECEEAMIILESASYLVKRYIHLYKTDIVKKVAHLIDNNKFASDFKGLNRLATPHEIKFCMINAGKRSTSQLI